MKGKKPPLSSAVTSLADLHDLEQERAQPRPDREAEDAATDIVDRYLKACGGERMGFVVGASERELITDITDIAIALMHARGRTEP
jgi:hypothetical protein